MSAKERLKYSLMPRGVELPFYMIGGMAGGVSGGTEAAATVVGMLYAAGSLGKYLGAYLFYDRNKNACMTINEMREQLDSSHNISYHSLATILIKDTSNLYNKTIKKFF